MLTNWRINVCRYSWSPPVSSSSVSFPYPRSNHDQGFFIILNMYVFLNTKHDIVCFKYLQQWYQAVLILLQLAFLVQLREVHVNTRSPGPGVRPAASKSCCVKTPQFIDSFSSGGYLGSSQCVSIMNNTCTCFSRKIYLGLAFPVCMFGRVLRKKQEFNLGV